MSKLLTQLASGTKIQIPDSVAAATALSDYALSARYPGFGEAVTEEEHAEAVRTATVVLLWAENLCK